ncbi:NAD(P)H:quinone oxidoreductase [Candidatus Berkelbacteria bacterium]|nr:NAD(P)H:quinone oxidoreductase [Candidatus Berkelbacteria bacterium]
MATEFKVLVLFYSFTGHTATLAHYIAEGAKEVEGASVVLMRAPELVAQEVIDTMPAAKATQERLQKIPVASLEDLKKADGVAFGTPVHFGSFASQIKQLLDGLSPIYIEASLVNKPAAVFCTGGTLHGGEEATLLSLIIPLLNLGMVPVGIPYPIQGVGEDFDAGSPYGATSTSGHHGEKPISEQEKRVARILGKRLAIMAKIIKHSCNELGECQILTTRHE